MQYTNEYISKKKKRKENRKRILTVIMYIIMLPIITYNIFLIIMSIVTPSQTPSFLGIKTFVILSGSMEPNLNIGDIVFIKEVEEKEIEKDDIISFREGQSIVTHRVVDIQQSEEGESLYTTKGDNNNAKDRESKQYEDIEGKYIGKIEKLGNLVLALKNKIVIITIILIFYIMYLYNAKNIKKRNERRKLRNKYERELINKEHEK